MPSRACARRWERRVRCSHRDRRAGDAAREARDGDAPLLILGACNPPSAHRAIELEVELGTLLPCNVIVYEQDRATHVAAVDPVTMLSIVDNPALEPVAAEIREKVERAVTKVWER